MAEIGTIDDMMMIISSFPIRCRESDSVSQDVKQRAASA